MSKPVRCSRCGSEAAWCLHIPPWAPFETPYLRCDNDKCEEKYWEERAIAEWNARNKKGAGRKVRARRA